MGSANPVHVRPVDYAIQTNDSCLNDIVGMRSVERNHANPEKRGVRYEKG